MTQPNKVAAEYRSGNEQRRVLYDGKTLTVFSKSKNLYAKEPMPATIAEMFKKLANEYGMVLPLSDLLAPDYDDLVADVQTGQYIGEARIGLYDCDHLAFTQDGIDWEIWLEQGDKPIPRKIRINYKQLPASPRHETLITSWNTDAPPSSAFSLTLPAGAVKTEMLTKAAAADDVNK